MPNALVALQNTDYEPIYRRIWDHYNRVTPFTAEEFGSLVVRSSVETIKKGTVLYRQGTIPSYGGYIIQGAVRYFSTNRVERRETTTGFQFEDSCFGDLRSIFYNEPAITSLQAMEDLVFARMDKKHYLHLFDHCKPFARMMVLSMEAHYNALMRDTIDRLDLMAEERYLKLLDEFPHILNRVSQRHIASYLGVKPQSLSRIRRSIMARRAAA